MMPNKPPLFTLRRWPWLLGTLVILLMGGVWSGLLGPHAASTGQAVVSAAEDRMAPAFALPSTTGDAVNSSDYVGQYPMLLAFYMGDF